MNKQKDELAIWAEHTAKKIDDSAVFMQLYNPVMTSIDEAREDPDYLLQIGIAIMLDKPIVVLVPYGCEIPDKLERVADVIEYFDRGSLDSIKQATVKALEKIDV